MFFFPVSDTKYGIVALAQLKVCDSESSDDDAILKYILTYEVQKTFLL